MLWGVKQVFRFMNARQTRFGDMILNDPDWVVHTNHPIVNTDLRIPFADLEKQTPSFKAERNEG